MPPVPQRVRDLWELCEANHDRAVLVGLGVATGARLAYVTALGDRLGGPDWPAYDGAAWDIARHGLVSPAAGLPFWPPGYPFLIAVHYRVFGHHPYAVKVTQVVMIAGLTWLTYRLAARLVTPRAALLTGLGMSASLAWLGLAHPLMYEPWLALFFVAATLFLLDGRWWAAGLMIGLACAFQNKVITLVPVLAIWMGASGKNSRRPPSVLAPGR